MHSEKDLSQLIRDRERALVTLEGREREWVADFRAIETSISRAMEGSSNRYRGIRSTTDAVLAYLGDTKRWIVKRPLAKELQLHGFTMDPEEGIRLVVATIDKMVQRKQLIARGEKKAQEVGLPGWPLDRDPA